MNVMKVVCKRFNKNKKPALHRWKSGSRPPAGWYWFLDGGLLFAGELFYRVRYDADDEFKYPFLRIEDHSFEFIESEFDTPIFGPIPEPNIGQRPRQYYF
jgi:hypothetical protein